MVKRNKGIDDAFLLDRPKFFILGIQHLFAMFGATILVLSIGVQYGTESGTVAIGPIQLSGLALAAIVGIILNAILPSEMGKIVRKEEKE